MPQLLRLLALVATLLLVAGCGGGDDKDSSTAEQSANSSAAAPAQSSAAAPGNDAAAVLAAATEPAGAVHSTFTVKAAFEGKPTDPTLSAFLTGPIELKVDGVGDAAAKSADASVEVKAGAFNFAAKVLSDGTKSWLGIGDDFYELPAGSGTSGGAPLDPSALTRAVGNPADYVKNAKIEGDDEVEGVKAQHLSGDVDVAALATMLQKVAASAGSTGIGSSLGGDASGADLSALQDAVDSAKVDVWIADDTKNVVRFALDLDVKVPDAELDQTSGITGARVQIAATAVPADAVTVTPPANAHPPEELQSALLQLLGGMGGLGGAPNS